MQMQTKEEEIAYCIQLGYTQDQILKAQRNCIHSPPALRMQHLLDQLDILSKQQPPPIVQSQLSGYQDQAYNDAILASYQTLKADNVSDYSTPVERLRKNSVPVGLKNTGNTCYFNSLLQTYFMNHQFVMEILDFKEPNDQDIKGLPAYGRIKESIKLVKHLQKLFGQMILSDKKYVDASLVLQSVVDEYGKFIPIGDQKDIGEFNIQFLTRIEEGLQSQEKYLSLQEQKKENEQQQQQEEQFIVKDEIGMDGSRSLKKSMTVVKLQGKQVLGQLFFGKQLQLITFPMEAKTEEKKQEELFSTIYLDVHFKNLYSSWEEANFQEIEYKTEQGKMIIGKKQNFLIQAPQLLFFQLSRVMYDKDLQALCKINDEFVFEKEIFIDRFMLKNKEVLMKTRESVKQLRKEAEGYEKALKELKNFQESNSNLVDIMTQCENFFKLQITGAQQKKKINEIIDPTFFGLKQSDSASTLKLITGAKTQIETRISKLQAKLTDLNQKIDQSFNKFKTMKYKLVGLLIHEGSADSGHYYSYIFDHNQQLWRKYNDSNVQFEKEEKVMKMAYGGMGHASAYYLIYFSEQQLVAPKIEKLQLDQSMVKQQLGIAGEQFINLEDSQLMRAYTTSENRKFDFYLSILMQNLQVFQEVVIENEKFQREVEIYQEQNAARDIVDNYSEKFSYVNEIARVIGQKVGKYDVGMQAFPVLVNFPIFLKKHKQNVNDKLQPLIKWHLLDSAIRDYKKTIHLDEVIKSPKYKNLLQHLTQAMSNLYEFKKPPLSINLEQYQEMVQQFMKNIEIAEITCYYLEKAFEQKWQLVLNGISNVIKDTLGNSSLFQIASRVYQIAFLSLCDLMEQLASKGNVLEFKKNFELLIAYAFQLKLEKNSFIHIQLIYWVQDILKKHLSTIEGNMKNEINHLMDQNLMNMIFNQSFNSFLTVNDNELNLRIEQVYEQDIWNITTAKKDDLLIEKIRFHYQKFCENFKWQNQMFEKIIADKKFLQEPERKVIMGIK